MCLCASAWNVIVHCGQTSKWTELVFDESYHGRQLAVQIRLHKWKFSLEVGAGLGNFWYMALLIYYESGNGCVMFTHSLLFLGDRL